MMETKDAEIHGGGWGREMSRAFREKLWIYRRKIHTDFMVTLVSLVRSGTRFSVYVKGLPKRIHLTNRPERCRISKCRHKDVHSFSNLSMAQLREQTAKFKAHTSVTL